MSVAGLVRLGLSEKRRRILGLVIFGAIFLVGGLAARTLAADPHGHPDPDRLFLIGGYPLVSSLLLMGWLLGRYPLIAVLVLVAGVVSHDRDEGHARLYRVRPISPIRVYGTRFLALAGVALLLSATLMPTFDLVMLGTWAGPATWVLALAYILVYGGLTALLSVWTRADAWIALGIGLVAMIWHALQGAEALPVPPGARDFIALLLPPHGALLRLEEAFAGVQPIPWDAFAFAAGYGLLALLLAGIALTRREI